MELLDGPLAALGQSPLRRGKGEEFGALKLIEIRQAVKREPLGWRQDGQPSAVAGAPRWIRAQ